MYWYISFLRPPPVGVTLPSNGVVITPQVANDLRTELRDEPTPISYVWHRVAPPPTAKPGERVAQPLITKPAELTTFEPPASTYRPVTVPLPRSARAGERWRLGLLSPPHPLEAPLLSLMESSVPIMGVWSESIELRAGEPSQAGPLRGVGANKKEKGKGKGEEDEKKGKGKENGKAKEEAKQTRITRAWPFADGELKLVEQMSFDLDKKVWDSGLALSSWLYHWLKDGWQRGRHPNAHAHEIIANLRAARTLELGSGTGLVGITLGLIDRKAQVTATDLDSAMEIMNENVTLNGVGHLVRADVLDWDAPLPPWAVNIRFVIAADVTYNTASFPALVDTLERLLKAQVDAGPPRLLLAYKQRDEGERELWTMLKDRGIGTVLVDTLQGAEDRGEIEIWVGGVGIA
ncbi:hypothetical protein CC85DRAFT_247547 [Cutaneotrichosporon oleaginosum]|uniref:Methyltransferase-domain-containing protein n=1 Tax=Cutaneotrichosporon oleaginosum TaxID=879819 RepID=A0A0J0XK71_9TREE|nr:uncharacterized protein CC85DRAFT_247547 [Cutaneotrichosporon oleaginosum]KLT41480.1 hypothetical protein CC85DRAFT_247547 [Cutaneotrichosporon oleaginosum]TXT05869.1 hypothetical protein COLE_07189 [Cutaneotrichosporon oleaginosum]